MERTAVRAAARDRGAAKSLSPRRRAFEVLMRLFLYLSAGLTVALLLFIIGTILVYGAPGSAGSFCPRRKASSMTQTVFFLPFKTLCMLSSSPWCSYCPLASARPFT